MFDPETGGNGGFDLETRRLRSQVRALDPGARTPAGDLYRVCARDVLGGPC